MFKFANLTIDFRDDTEGEIFKQIFPTFESIPECVKEASIEDPQDHEYAVSIDDNGIPLRKFAIHDAGNTYLSLAYLSKVAHLLPAEVVKEAGEGIWESVERFKMEIPEELKDFGKSTGTPVVTRERSFRPSLSFEDIQDPVDGRSPDSGDVIKGKKLLEGKYPVDDYYQTKKAEEYWNDNWRDFKPKDRKEYCTKLASRMQELCVDIPEDIKKYASTGYSYDIDNHLQLRKDLADYEHKETVDLLIEKRAYVDPFVFAEALQTFDKIAGLEVHWDSILSDPYRSTFGDSVEKIAEDNWRYNGDGQYIREDHLNSLSKNYHDIKQILGSELANDFMSAPKKTFEGLSQIHKTMIARRASQEVL